MKRLTAGQTRRTFLDFFVHNGHTEVASAPLVPANDPTLLFTNAGMVQFKDTFLGLEARPYRRATTVQKILRVSGKHNDLEEVGPSPRHHTFFEMLGNFSFGDYFKREAIRLAWELLTVEFALPVERLWFTVFEGDRHAPADLEAEQFWIEAGAAPDRILRFGASDNFWVMGDTGPCGPNSEITMYIGDDPGRMHAGGVNSDDPDYVEIWNLVFMQFDRATMQPLPRPGVDTGMGLERMCMAMQGVHSTYDTDLFRPIIERTMALTGGDEAHYREHLTAYRAVADHTRACTFLIADGILPGNAGRSYVLRRVLRRAAYQGRTIGLVRPFLAETAEVVIQTMGHAYPELLARRDFIEEMITAEEERFGRTITAGLTLLDRDLASVPAGGELPGSEAFALYDTHGFPLDLTQKILAERGYSLDTAGFEAAMEDQKRRSQGAGQFKVGIDATVWAGQELPPTEFVGYADLAGRGRILAVMVDGDTVSAAQEGQQVQIALDRTPFYAQGGGQVGDTGILQGPHGRVRVEDTLRPVPGLFVHHGVVEEGVVTAGEEVGAQVDDDRRLDIMRNHTATHLLHRVIRDVLGAHATQAESLVAPTHLRFGVTHGRAIGAEDLHEIERRVNDWVRADTLVDWTVLGYQEALDQGAMALFGEKYGDRVRMVIAGCAGGGQDFCSRELCGGTHVARTGQIGSFRIVSESSSAGGVRRIEALTGRGAEEWASNQAATVREAAARLGAQPGQLVERLDAVLAEMRRQQQEIAALRSRAGRGSLEQALEGTQQADGVRYVAARVEASDKKILGEMGDWLRDKLGSGAVVLGTVLDEKAVLLAVVTDDLVAQGFHAGRLVGRLAQIVGARGGGRPTRAEGGGPDIARLGEALALVGTLLIEERQR